MPRPKRHLPQGHSLSPLWGVSETPVAPKDHKRALNTLRYIHANPKAAGVRKGFYAPYSNYGHYSRLESDGITQWHPSFLQLAATLKGCSKRYINFCKKYRYKSKPSQTRQWGSKLIALLKGTATQPANTAATPRALARNRTTVSPLQGTTLE